MGSEWIDRLVVEVWCLGCQKLRPKNNIKIEWGYDGKPYINSCEKCRSYGLNNRRTAVGGPVLVLIASIFIFHGIYRQIDPLIDGNPLVGYNWAHALVAVLIWAGVMEVVLQIVFGDPSQS